VCDVLCFLRHKLVTTPSKTLKTALLDFYTTEVLSAAKNQLINDIDSVKSVVESSVKLPYVPKRRDGDGRAVKEVDDIVLLFTHLDENKLLDNLPRYVADGPDTMPSMRLYEGDLNSLTTLMKKMEAKMLDYESAIVSLTRDLRALQDRFTPASVSTLALAESGRDIQLQPAQPRPYQQVGQPPRNAQSSVLGEFHGESIS